MIFRFLAGSTTLRGSGTWRCNSSTHRLGVCTLNTKWEILVLSLPWLSTAVSIAWSCKERVVEITQTHDVLKKILFTNPNYAGEKNKIAGTTVMKWNKWLLKQKCFHSAKGKGTFWGLISGILEKILAICSSFVAVLIGIVTNSYPLYIIIFSVFMYVICIYIYFISSSPEIYFT